MTAPGLALAVALAVAAASPAPVSFPGAAEAKDPTGRYAVVLAPAEGRRELRLQVLASGASRPLLTLHRSAAVFWSPDGSSVAVTDRRSADSTTALLFFADRPESVDLAAALAKDLGPLPELTENRRVFLEVVRWLDAKRLRVRLRGWGNRDPEGFDELFDYELGGRFRRASSLVPPAR